MPYPRPILKHLATSSDDSDSPNFHEGGLSRMNTRTNKVHFPNHPDALARMHPAHSPDDYDRSPIRIRPNSCALPERGCPGRTFSEDESQQSMDVDIKYMSTTTSSAGLRRGNHRHPCAKVVGFLVDESGSDTSDLPSLVFDISDTSEESDNGYSSSSSFLSDPLSPPASRNWFSSTGTPSASTSMPAPSPRLSPKADPAQLAFLPYPHVTSTSSGGSAPPSFYPSGGPPTRDSRSTRRSPSSPTRQRSRSRSRVRGSPARERHGASIMQAPYDAQDEGCLGGF